jgi:hypothetical protein
MNFDNTNSGALFRNDKKGNEKRPDYKGTINVNGTDYWLSAWLKSSKAGAKYMSLSVQPKEADPGAKPEQHVPAPAQGADFDDDIPF